jgi:hypothetical protein
MKIFRLAVRAVVLLTTGPALLALTACTVSSVAILLTISGHMTPGLVTGSAPSFTPAPAIAASPAAGPARAGGSAAAIASVPVDSPSPVQAPAASPRHYAGPRPAIAPAEQFGNGTIYYAWIIGVRQGRPGGVRQGRPGNGPGDRPGGVRQGRPGNRSGDRPGGVRQGRPGNGPGNGPGTVTMEMAWHYTGKAEQRYAAEHHLPSPAGGYIDIDRRLAATVSVARSARISINLHRCGPQQLSASAFLGHAARDLAIKVNGQLTGPLYEVAFDNDVLVSACQVREP